MNINDLRGNIAAGFDDKLSKEKGYAVKEGQSSTDNQRAAQKLAVTASIGVEVRQGREVFASAIFASAKIGIVPQQPVFKIDVPSPAQVAGVVLGAVERRLSAEKAAGADADRLNQLMAAAQEGVEEGFSSAREEIEGLGLMTDELDVEITESYDLIDKGLDGFQQQIDSGEYAFASVLESAGLLGREDVLLRVGTSDDSAAPSRSSGSDEVVSQGKALGINVDSYAGRYAQAESYQLKLRTQEGDEVSISLKSAFAEGLNVRGNAAEYAFSQDQAFELSVKGDLNADEQLAIEQFLSQVSDVAELFFSDDFQGAFDAVLTLGFDSSEIASFSLDLSKSVYQEVRSYGQGNGLGLPQVSGVKALMPLVEMTNNLGSVLNSFEGSMAKINQFVLDVIARTNEIYSDSNRAISDERLANYSDYSFALIDEMIAG